ncbi:hypothetical protein Pan241w_45010 [Gimesia alba]|uniref:Uncharacterized protein n=1 Tax=Gimesia alba TaxID=2527973 RepID=A0A517RKP1_9PLAN|nr:hypothetical protein [Gimesia alba]QDT44392.1 hypothetical protein Pan241w_45010 [Gimesia alba]
MNSFIRSLLLTACLAPFQFGCGEEAPLTPPTEEPVEELDPAVEAEAQKEALRNQ